jgi:Lipase (class 3)
MTCAQHSACSTQCGRGFLPAIAGALASVFAMGLAVDAPDMMKRIGGVLTYGQPRVGDAEYASIFEDNFGAVTL